MTTPTPAPAGVPLWDDERIARKCNDELGYTEGANAMSLMRDMRDSYEAELAKLRRLLAEQWTPVDDDWSYNSEEHLSLRVTHGGGTLRATDYAVYGSPVPLVNDHHLPDHIRLCSKPKEQAE